MTSSTVFVHPATRQAWTEALNQAHRSRWLWALKTSVACIGVFFVVAFVFTQGDPTMAGQPKDMVLPWAVAFPVLTFFFYAHMDGGEHLLREHTLSAEQLAWLAPKKDQIAFSPRLTTIYTSDVPMLVGDWQALVALDQQLTEDLQRAQARVQLTPSAANQVS